MNLKEIGLRHTNATSKINYFRNNNVEMATGNVLREFRRSDSSKCRLRSHQHEGEWSLISYESAQGGKRSLEMGMHSGVMSKKMSMNTYYVRTTVRDYTQWSLHRNRSALGKVKASHRILHSCPCKTAQIHPAGPSLVIDSFCWPVCYLQMRSLPSSNTPIEFWHDQRWW